MYCAACNVDLHGKPKINVEGATYCFSCAKVRVPALEAARRDAASYEYESAKSIYDSERDFFNRLYADWAQKRRKFVGSGNLGCALAVVGAAIAFFIAGKIAKGFGFIGVIATFFRWGKLRHNREAERDCEFRTLNPEPIFDRSAPQHRGTPPVYHSPEYHDGSTVSRTNYREEILRRDNFICQACGKKRQRRTLEIHHIIPRSKGGTDVSTNLITLCKYCHDREDWYEHVRVFPTTIRATKQTFRRRWRRT